MAGLVWNADSMRTRRSYYSTFIVSTAIELRVTRGSTADQVFVLTTVRLSDDNGQTTKPIVKNFESNVIGRKVER